MLVDNGYCAADILDGLGSGRRDAILLSLSVFEIALGVELSMVEACVQHIFEKLHVLCAGTGTLITYHASEGFWDHPPRQLLYDEGLQVC